MGQEHMLREHMKAYISQVMERKLREEGFETQNHLNWYRIVNRDVIHSIYFRSSYPMFPIVMQIRYGCHPMFIKPIFSNEPSLKENPKDEVMNTGVLCLKSSNSIFSSEIQVLCPADDARGADFLDKVLTLLSTIRSPYDCYKQHRNWKREMLQENNFLDISECFLDEVVYWQDHLLYPACIKWIENREKIISRMIESRGPSSVYECEVRQLTLLKRALAEDGREEYIQHLMERETHIRHILSDICKTVYRTGDG